MLGGDVVAMWDVALSDCVYRIQFSHGTTTGRRIVYVNGQEVVRRDRMFKLVGRETFSVGGANTRASVLIEAVRGLAYEYSLQLEGRSLQRFTADLQDQTCRTWRVRVDGEDCRVVLEKDTMDVWCNGQKMDTTGQFVDDGTETRFVFGEHECCIKATSSGKKKGRIVHHLLLDAASAQ
ncbi:fas apoptotic inhibitory molecule 1-like [Lycodopsis pacificus]